MTPGRPALRANKQLKPIDCSNAASVPSVTRPFGSERQQSTPKSKQIILNEPLPQPPLESQCRVAVGASETKRGAHFVSLLGQTRWDGNLQRGVRKDRQHASDLPSSTVASHSPALFETRSLTHSCSTPFKYFKRVGCGAITRLLDDQRVHPPASSYLLNLQIRAGGVEDGRGRWGVGRGGAWRTADLPQTLAESATLAADRRHDSSSLLPHNPWRTQKLFVLIFLFSKLKGHRDSGMRLWVFGRQVRVHRV